MADAVASSAPRKKKLPFKPTALRRPSLPKPSASPDDADVNKDDGLALFSRKKEMEATLAADRERNLRRKLRKEKEKRLKRESNSKRLLEYEEEDRRASTPREHDAQMSPAREGLCPGEPPATDESTAAGDSFREDNPIATPPSKRSRLGSAADLDINSTPWTSASKEVIPSVERPSYTMDESPSARLTRSHRKHDSPTQLSKADTTPRHTNIISLDSDSDSDAKVVASSTSKTHSSSLEIIDRTSPKPSSPPPEAEDEFAEFVRAAEQRRRDAANSTKDKIDIIITSTVPDSRPCCIKYTFDKHLGLVRDSWVALQKSHRIPLPLASADDEIILTWRRKRVYRWSSLADLGIVAHGDGRVTMAGGGRSSDGIQGRRVHLEAWTPALFNEMEIEEDIRRKREAGEISDDDDPAEEPPAPYVKIRVILRARDYEDVKLMARPETTAETLITGFKSQRGVGNHTEVVLRFDGESLAEHTTMQDADVDDMDVIEVHIK